MKRESLIRIYVGNKLLGSHFPVLVVTGDNTWEKNFFGEHYFFSDVPNLPFISRRDIINPEDARPDFFDFNAYPEIFSAESLLKSQIIAARADIEYTLSNLDMKSYKEIFWEGRLFEFTECDDYPLVQFHVFGKHSVEMAAMFEFTRSKSLRELHEKLLKLPKIKIEKDYAKGR
jgi:hypothetical protein